MARVWPDRIVEENNLQGQISALRAALGADRNRRSASRRRSPADGCCWCSKPASM
jgi:hypothetical protein